MPDLNFVILYVDKPRASATFYATLFGRDPVEVSDTFAMLPAASGVMLGLWSRQSVKPPAAAAGGAPWN